MRSEPDRRPPKEPTTEEKVAFLADPASYPGTPGDVEVRETHMSWVFLVDELVYKMKKAVRYDFLDFQTLAAREYFVAEEVRLNRRLAADVYLGAVPITRDGAGALHLNGPGDAVEWLVKMRRLPQDLMLDQIVAEGCAAERAVRRLGERLATFYAGLRPVASSAENYRDRFAREHRRTAEVLRDPRFAFDGARVDSVIGEFESELLGVRPLLDARVAQGRIIEGHGDLRPEHVCLTDPPVIIDCLEFDRALRLVDPFDEIVFLGLECVRFGADWVLPILRETLVRRLDDDPPSRLLSFYWRYRALLRARLALLHLVEPNPRQPEKWRPLAWRYVELAEAADVSLRSPIAR